MRAAKKLEPVTRAIGPAQYAQILGMRTVNEPQRNATGGSTMTNITDDNGDFRARWVRVSVEMFDHHIFDGDPYTRRSAWLWLIAKAAWKPHRIRNKGMVATLERGQCLAGLEYLSKTWGWSIKKVRNFLSELEAENMIEKGKSKGHYANVITICNYGKYQDVRQVEGQVCGQVRGKCGASAGQDSTRNTNTTTSSTVLSEAAREPCRAAAPPDDFLDRLTKAAEPCLDNPANCMGLLTSGIPQMWLNQGCDLERDILPVLRAAAVKYRGKSIRDWNYFTAMIAEAKARRERGLPPVTVTEPKKQPASTFSHPQRRDEEREYQETLAWAKNMGLINEHVN